MPFMFCLSPNARVAITIEGTPAAVRVVKHKRDDTKLMLKAAEPEGLAFAWMCGVTPGAITRGKNFWMAPVRKDALLAGLRQAVEVVLAGTNATRDVPPSSTAQ